MDSECLVCAVIHPGGPDGSERVIQGWDHLVGTGWPEQRVGGKYHMFRVNLFSLYQSFLLTGTVRRPGPGGPASGGGGRCETICSLCYCCTSLVAMLAAAVLALTFT